MPAATIASASGTVATATPRAPSATCRRAISGHLCVLACGRAAQPRVWQCSEIVRRLASKASRSSSRAGVGISSLVRPPGALAAASARRSRSRMQGQARPQCGGGQEAATVRSSHRSAPLREKARAGSDRDRPGSVRSLVCARARPRPRGRSGRRRRAPRGGSARTRAV